MEQDAVLPTGHPNNGLKKLKMPDTTEPWYTNKWLVAAVIAVIIGFIVVIIYFSTKYFSTKPKSTVPVSGIPPPPNASTPASALANTPPSSDKTKEMSKIESDPKYSPEVQAKEKAQMEVAKGPAVKVTAEAPAPAGGPLDGYMAPVNIDYPYNDLGNFPSSNPVQCAMKCNQNPRCKLFVTANDSQNCWIKSDAQNKTPSAARNTYAKKGFNLP